MPILATILALSLAAGPAFSEQAPARRPASGLSIDETPARRQASAAAAASADAASRPDPESATKAAAAAFKETSGDKAPAGPAVRSFGGHPRPSTAGTRGGPQTFAASAVPSVHAAQKGVYAAEDDKPPPWDYDGTMKAAVFALGGAVIGFMVGGPIGACVGFLAGFFIGALLWKAGALG